MITIVRLRAQVWLGFMFSNLPNILLTARLKQTSSQSVTRLDWGPSLLSSQRSYLSAPPTKGRPNINLEILRHIDGILDWNVDCPEGKMISVIAEARTARPELSPNFRWRIKALSGLLYLDWNVVEDGWLRFVYLFNQCKVWKFV